MTVAQVQLIAKQTMSYMENQIKVGMRLRDIRDIAEDRMLSLGATSFWYWDIGAFIFSGRDTRRSVSGKRYRTKDKRVECDDIITIDLSPQSGDSWVDYARTFVIEGGEVVRDIDAIKNAEWRDGIAMTAKLHELLSDFVSPRTTFEALYNYINRFLKVNGYINCDFLGNLGHSIATDKGDRIYIEKGNTAELSAVEYFTFEPHISIKRGKYGFKREDIYYFQDNQLVKL